MDKWNCCRYYSALLCKQCGRAVKTVTEIYDDEVNGSQIGNHSCSIDWHWLTLNCTKFRSQDFQFKYLDNGKRRYAVGLKGHQIGNQPWTFDYVFRPSMTLNLLVQRHYNLTSNISKAVTYTYDNGVNGSRIGNHSCSIS